MEKSQSNVRATFKSADGLVIIKSINQYRQYDHDNVIEFTAENGKQYLAYMRDIILMNVRRLSALSVS